jgi:hypothetical protein
MKSISKLTDEFKSRIKSLPVSSQIKLAWRCALRALPFLGINDVFNQWADKERQQYLINSFHALDTSIAFVLLPKKDISYNGFTGADGFYGDCFFVPNTNLEYTNTANYKLPAIYTDYLAYAVDSFRAINKTINVINNAVLSSEQIMTGDYNSNGTHIIESLTSNFEKFVFHAIEEAINPTTSVKTSHINIPNLFNSLLDDLSIIENDANFKMYSLIPCYGEIWDIFQQFLTNSNLKHAFIVLFNKNFELDNNDINELQMRI